MRIVTLILLFGIGFLCGCASTVADRRKQMIGAYSQLPSEMQTLVDTGQIKVGLPKDAVYIAWGKPDQTVQGESAQGKAETWLYYGSTLHPYQYWNYGYWGPWHHSYYYSGPYLDTDWYPVYYIAREVQFENDRVKSWRSMPRTPY